MSFSCVYHATLLARRIPLAATLTEQYVDRSSDGPVHGKTVLSFSIQCISNFTVAMTTKIFYIQRHIPLFYRQN